jgi:5-methylcytosine-specific restriction endonuclease McrA
MAAVEETVSTRRQPIPDDVKVQVWQRDGGRCASCGSNEELEFDHIIPLVMGGSNTFRNLQLLCGSCNRAKGGRLV